MFVQIGKTLKLRKTRIDNGEMHVEVDDYGGAVLLKWEPMIEEAGLRSVFLPSGSNVKISSFTSPTSMYLQSVHREHMLTLAELNQDVTSDIILRKFLKSFNVIVSKVIVIHE